jgi:hypothetical protein
VAERGGFVTAHPVILVAQFSKLMLMLASLTCVHPVTVCRVDPGPAGVGVRELWPGRWAMVSDSTITFCPCRRGK